MNTEDDEFNRIEREAKQRMEAVRATVSQQEFVCSTGLCHYRKPLPDGIPSPDELEALSDGNSGMIFNEGFPTKLDRLACWLREYAAIEAAHQIGVEK